MIFQEGQKHVSLYETPYGGLMLGVNTHRAEGPGNGGGAPLHAHPEVDSQPIGENSFEIQVTEPHLIRPRTGSVTPLNREKGERTIMANLIQHAKDQVSQLTAQAYAAAAAAGSPPGGEVKGSVEIPQRPQNGTTPPPSPWPAPRP